LPDIKTIENDIRARLAELEGLIEPLRVEAEQLRKLAAQFDDPSAALSALAAVQARRRGRPAGAGAAKRVSRSSRPAATPSGPKRGRSPGSGDRAAQAVELIAGQPGITVAELAAALGTAPNYLYRVLPRLQREGKITKRGKGYHVPGAEEQDSPTDG
jgi:CRP-like cAMP-binding protein